MDRRASSRPYQVQGRRMADRVGARDRRAVAPPPSAEERSFRLLVADLGLHYGEKVFDLLNVTMCGVLVHVLS